MEQRLEKILDSETILHFEEGMVGHSTFQGATLVRARFIWREEKWWHLLIHPPKFQPVWLRIKPSSLGDWTPELNDPATSGILLDRFSFYHESTARFRGEALVLEDGRSWEGASRLDSLKASLKP